MRTPEEKYRNDVMYATFVNHLEAMLHAANMTPSEIREAALLACIHYEFRTIRGVIFEDIPDGVKQALDVMATWKKSGKDEREPA